MTMRKISGVRVTLEDGSEVDYDGAGQYDVVDTFVPGDPETYTPRRPVRYLSLILSLPASK